MTFFCCVLGVTADPSFTCRHGAAMDQVWDGAGSKRLVAPSLTAHQADNADDLIGMHSPTTPYTLSPLSEAGKEGGGGGDGGGKNMFGSVLGTRISVLSFWCFSSWDVCL